MNNLSLILLFFLGLQTGVGQEQPYFIDYDWENNPVYKVDTSVTEDILELKSKVVTEFIYDKNDDLVEYFLEHRVMWLNSDHAIERFNKVYLPHSGSTELLVSKARVVTGDGKILELDKSNIFTASDEETGRQYKYFAFEGIEKGSFIEYFYVEQRNPNYNGNRLFLQSDIQKEQVEFDFFAPKNLVFTFKAYNGLPSVERDTLTQNKLHWKLGVDGIEKLEEEELSAYNATRASVVYKLDHNLYNNQKDLSSYGGISQNIYAFYYPEHSKKTQKALDKFIAEVFGKERSGEEETVIRKLEFFIKNNVYYTEGSADALKDLDVVLEKKVANETGMLKLYTAALTALDIKHDLVLTCDRQDLKFDKDFEAYNFLQDFLIYFPKNKKYLSPVERASRYGFPPAYLTDTYGLFIKKVSVGTLTSGLGKIDYIEPVKAEKTTDKMLINVEFSPGDLSAINVHLDRGLSGYYGMYIHPFMNLVQEKDKKELIDNFAFNLDEAAEITNKDLLNADPELFGLQPLQFVLDFKSAAFMEKAGNKYIFKIGELIGRQIELYQEKERKLPLENEFQRSYYRTIKIEIPEGYRISNLDDLNIHNTFSSNGEEVLSFHSFYEVKDNILNITADEHYRVNIVDVNRYEDYRTVINSAADFNKISLILEPNLN
ncbi:DUF3857 domain-containing protein [Salinimicrobium xinjiangense]|uniref:DUF3857 domain-containing protein n=1 Tax=Salinimicrobium xinjiangense TaxID=438596 RepID=UPI00042385FC|nr:DUF3857 domain-containing protein [Salinimicrobium xinjiangense]